MKLTLNDIIIDEGCISMFMDDHWVPLTEIDSLSPCVKNLFHPSTWRCLVAKYGMDKEKNKKVAMNTLVDNLKHAMWHVYNGDHLHSNVIEWAVEAARLIKYFKAGILHKKYVKISDAEHSIGVNWTAEV